MPSPDELRKLRDDVRRARKKVDEWKRKAYLAERALIDATAKFRKGDRIRLYGTEYAVHEIEVAYTTQVLYTLRDGCGQLIPALDDSLVSAELVRAAGLFRS